MCTQSARCLTRQTYRDQAKSLRASQPAYDVLRCARSGHTNHDVTGRSESRDLTREDIRKPVVVADRAHGRRIVSQCESGEWTTFQEIAAQELGREVAGR